MISLNLKKATKTIFAFALFTSFNYSSFASPTPILTECSSEIEKVAEFEASNLESNYKSFKFSSLELDESVTNGKVATFSNKNANISIFYQPKECYIYDVSVWFK
jgi:hypothetical protein